MPCAIVLPARILKDSLAPPQLLMQSRRHTLASQATFFPARTSQEGALLFSNSIVSSHARWWSYFSETKGILLFWLRTLGGEFYHPLLSCTLVLESLINFLTLVCLLLRQNTAMLHYNNYTSGLRQRSYRYTNQNCCQDLSHPSAVFNRRTSLFFFVFTTKCCARALCVVE